MTTTTQGRNRAICSTSWKPMSSVPRKHDGKWFVILFALAEGDIPVAVRYVPSRDTLCWRSHSSAPYSNEHALGWWPVPA